MTDSKQNSNQTHSSDVRCLGEALILQLEISVDIFTILSNVGTVHSYNTGHNEKLWMFEDFGRGARGLLASMATFAEKMEPRSACASNGDAVKAKA